METKIFGILPIKMVLDKRLNLNDLRIYAALSSFQGIKENCFPSLRKISDRSGINPNHISKHTKRLEKYGYIKKTRRGKRISNVYFIQDDYTKSVESPKSDYTAHVESDYPLPVKSDYTERVESNIKTTSTTTKKTTPSDEEVIFENKYFKVTKLMFKEWSDTYRCIDKFQPELTRVSGIITEREQKGEVIKSPMAFLHSHLKTLNIKNREGTNHGKYQTEEKRNYYPRGTSKEPKPIADLLQTFISDGNK